MGHGSGGRGGTVGDRVPLAGCTECLVHVPKAPKSPAPLLVTFHGDEGPAIGVPGSIGLFSAGADAHGTIVLALACSSDLGCVDGNFSGWLASQGYRITAERRAFIEAQVKKMESLYDIDVKREYLAGTSGGAYVLGYLAQAEAARYAGAAFVAGGMAAWTGTGNGCPTRKIPGYFLGGDRDPRTGGQMSELATSFQGCGEEIQLDLVAGADHGQTIASLGTGRADAILSWLEARPLP
jgi:poly(3-hydroxybutyrate) depolymerase